MIVGGMMLTCIPFSLYFGESDWKAIGGAAIVTIFTGFLFRQFKPKTGNNHVRKREGYLIVASGWISMVLFSALPYLFSGLFDNPVDAFFESISGMTTTGATILNDIETMPKGLLFWRSLTQWIGGMGIIVLTVALFPLLGIGGIELFVAEAPGPTSDKIHPRIQQTAKSTVPCDRKPPRAPVGTQLLDKVGVRLDYYLFLILILLVNKIFSSR